MTMQEPPIELDQALDTLREMIGEADTADTAEASRDITGQATEGIVGILEGFGAGEIAGFLHTFLNFPVFSLGETDVTPMLVLIVGVLILFTWWSSNLLQRWVERAFHSRGVTDQGTTAVVKRLLHYLVMAIGLGIALDTMGVSLGALFAAGAIFAVGIGFAMQNIAQNFVSGLILLVERAIKPGDVVEVEGRVVRVLKMGIRTTVARTRDEEEIIIPNAMLVQTAVKNFTLDDPLFRLRVDVGVAYESDMREVRNALLAATEDLDWRVVERDPIIVLSDFGDSAVEWQISLWTNNAWIAPRQAAELREAIWWSLADHGITIAFPQIDVHFDPPVTEGLSELRPTG